MKNITNDESKQKVVKHNSLINATFSLDTIEQRLILLAIVEARKIGVKIDANTIIDVPATLYAKTFHVDLNSAYYALKDASKSLYERKLTFTSKDQKKVLHARWTQRAEYVDQKAIVKIAFSVDIVPYISMLESNFTTYEVHQISHLASKYAIRMYELMIQWKNTGGKVPSFTLEDFRQKLGLETHEYKNMSDFKKRVLHPAIKQINEHTNIQIEMPYQQVKTGRVVSGFNFEFNIKKERDHKIPTALISPLFDSNLSDEKDEDYFRLSNTQIQMFSQKLSRLQELSKYADGNESYESLANKLADMLKSKQQQKKLHSYLFQVGYKKTP